MKYFYRDITVFEYFDGEVIQHNRVDGKPAFDCCRWTAEACKELAEFFALVARHKNGEDVELKDIGEWEPLKRGKNMNALYTSNNDRALLKAQEEFPNNKVTLHRHQDVDTEKKTCVYPELG